MSEKRSIIQKSQDEDKLGFAGKKKSIEECFYYIKNGANIKQGVIDGGYPITRIETLANDQFNRDRMGYAGIEDLKKYEEYILEDGDILMSHINSVQYLGRAVVYNATPNESIIHGMNLLKLKANRSIIEPEYARYLFYTRSFREQISKITKKSVNQASFAISDLKKIMFHIPSLNEQKVIIARLKKTEQLIVNRKQELLQLETLIKARFVEMFGELGIGAKFEIKRLEDCCYINPKKNENSKLKEELEVSFISMSAVSENGDIDTSEIRLYADVKTGFTYFVEGDVLFAKITPCMENGKGAVARGLKNGIGFGSTEFHVLRPKNKIIDSVWLYILMSFKQFRVDAESKMTGSAGQRRVPVSFLENYKVSIPPLELQNDFADFVVKVNKLKVEVQKSLNEMQTLFDSLMQRYFG